MKKGILLFLFFVFTFSLKGQWQQTNGPWGGQVWKIVNDNNRLYGLITGGNMVTSNDSGRNWNHLNVPNYGLEDFVKVGQYIIGGNYLGIFRTSDEGLTWSNTSIGLADSSVQCVGVNNGIIYAGCDTGVYVSNDTGITWLRLDNPLQPFTNVWKLVAFDSTIIINPIFDSLWRSDDFGTTWSRSNGGIGNVNCQVRSFEYHLDTLFAGLGNGLFESFDGGNSWIEINQVEFGNTSVSDILFRQNKIWITSPQKGIYYSADGGINWTRSGFGLLDNQHEISLGSDNGILFCGYGTSGGIYRSLDDGNSWLSSSLGINYIQSYAITTNAAGVYSAGLDNGIHFSSDQGGNWNSKNSDINYDNIRDIETSGDTIYAACGNGVWRTINAGQNWINIFPGKSIFGLFVNENILVASSVGDTMYFSFNAGLTWTTNNVGMSQTGCREIRGNQSGQQLFGLGGYLIHSSNSGMTWNQIVNGPIAFVEAGTFYHDSIFYCIDYYQQLFKTDNYGQTWIPVFNFSQLSSPFDIPGQLVSYGDFLIVGISNQYTGDYFRYSHDGGSTWYVLGNGYFGQHVSELVYDSVNLYASTQIGVWKFPLSQITDIREEEQSFKFEIFPNPSTGIISIVINSPGEKNIFVYNVIGELVFSENYSGTKNEIDLSFFPSGTYFMKVTTLDGIITKKLIKKH